MSAGPPLFAASDIALAVRWGMDDYGRILEGSTGRRVTRKVARALRMGASLSTDSEGGSHRGHRGMRKSPSAASNPETAHADALLLSLPETSMSLVERDAPPLESELVEDEVRHSGSTLSNSGERQMVAVGPERVLVVREPLPMGRTSFTSWFDLCEADDQLGGLPDGWEVNSIVRLPTLPVIEQSNISLLDDFWQEVDSSSSDEDCDEEKELQLAIAASL
ncbi:hypothetical protein OH76DRAFT_1361354, partial [Lentinus brumalis]